MDIKRFFNFDLYITTTVVKILYGLLCVLMLLAGLGYVALSLLAFKGGVGSGLIAVAIALGMLLIGIPLILILYRISFECVLVLFKINENLQKLADASGPPA